MIPKRRKKLLICFTGVDGSGKTSHAYTLLLFLRKRGYASKYVRAASRPIFVYPFLLITRIFGFWKKIKKGAWTDPLGNAPKLVKQKLSGLFHLLLFIDFQIIFFIKVYLPSLMTDIIVCDRYVYDLIIELVLSNIYSSNFAKIVLRTAYKPDITFLMDAPLHTIMQRRQDVEKENLQIKINAYRKFAKIFGFKIIDTTTDFRSNQAYIQREVLSLFRKCLG